MQLDTGDLASQEVWLRPPPCASWERREADPWALFSPGLFLMPLSFPADQGLYL